MVVGDENVKSKEEKSLTFYLFLWIKAKDLKEWHTSGVETLWRGFIHKWY